MIPNLRRSILFAAGGFAFGLSTAAVACRQEPIAARAPLVEVRAGQVANGHPPRELRPLTVRVGDELRQLGHARAERPAVATVYLAVSGVPVVASFELAE
jgi:hypothetical protein